MGWEERIIDSGKVVLLIGPTAVGKSRLAVEMAKQHSGEIISMDSCAVYRGLDIGSAKPGEEEREGIKHHLIDILNPDKRYSAGKFFHDTLELVREIRGRKKLPIIVGGTILYANTLLNGIASIPAISPGVREKAQFLLETEGREKAYQRLEKQDLEFARRVHPNDQKRILRAWEVLLETGKPLGQWLAEGNSLPDFDMAVCVMTPYDKAEHKTVLNERVDKMMEEGFLYEVSCLVTKYGSAATALNAVGYRQLVTHVTGLSSIRDAVVAAKKATARLAKHQMTWIRKINSTQQDITWIQ